MRNIFKGLFIVIACLVAGSAWAQTGKYSTRVISTDGKTSTWTFDVVSGSAVTVADDTDDNGILYVNGGGSNKAQTSKYFSFNKSEVYLEVPSGSAGSIKMEVSSSSDSRWFQLYINTKEGPATQRLWSKAGDGTDGKKGPQSFTFASTDITTKNAKTYLYLKTNDTEMKVKSFTITLTSGSYSGGPAPKSNDATLKSIVYGTNQTPIPGFAADKLSYEVELPADYVGSAPSVQATANDTKATVDITQATTLPGTAKIDVTAEDGTTKLQYTVTFTKASAAPKVESATWANIKGTATIDNVNLTITGEVTNGSSLTLTPQFTGKNIASYTPTGAQNFANGAINYTFTSASSENTVYAVTITEAPAMSSDATLKSLTYGGTSVPNFSPSTYVYNIQLTEGIKTPPVIAAVANDSKAKVVITQASSVPGSGKVEVTAEDGTKLTYTINYTVVVPPTKLTLHVPEVYEAKEIAGGYGGTLSEFEGHEYEVYYCSYDSSGNLSFTVTPIQKRVGISGEPRSETAVRARDNWFEGTATGGKSNFSFTNKDEYIQGSGAMHKLKNGNTYTFHIKGYEEFSFLGKDNNADASKGRHFEVYVDDVLQPMTVSASATIRRFTITTDEHVIKLKALHDGDSNNELYGFSLRVAQEPRTKYLKGNDSTQKVLQTQAIQPIVYVTKYNNIQGAETKLEWIGNEATGISLAKKEGGLTDTLTLSGTAQCKVGTYNYAVVAYYNNVETSRATGSFKVATDIRPMTELNAEVYQNEEMDQIKFRYYALSADSVKLTWPSSQPAEITGKGAANNTYIIGGIPTATEGLYPYEITIAGADTVFKGVIKVKKLDYGTNPVLYLYKNTGAEEKDGVYSYLANNWNMISRKAKEDGMRTEEQYAKYKWILISEDADANNPEVLGVVSGKAKLPVLNMNAFTYAYESDDDTPKWGEPDNGSISKGGCYITIQRDDHPIFQGIMKKKRGDRIQVLDSVDFKGLMPVNIKKQGTLCLATSPTRDIEDYFADGEMQTIIHEIPASMHGGSKYIAFPIAKNSSKVLTSDGKKLLGEIVNYLTSNQTTVKVPTVQITGFSVNGIAGVIDQEQKTIQVNIDRTKYPDINLKEVQPVVTVASEYTYVVPATEDTVDLSTSSILPVKYVVSDYINRTVYNVTVTLYTPEGIEEIYTAGDWVNVYDIFGRKIATTNEDIFTMSLPRGVYVIVTESGKTLKITR